MYITMTVRLRVIDMDTGATLIRTNQYDTSVVNITSIPIKAKTLAKIKHELLTHEEHLTKIAQINLNARFIDQIKDEDESVECLVGRNWGTEIELVDITVLSQ